MTGGTCSALWKMAILFHGSSTGKTSVPFYKLFLKLIIDKSYSQKLVLYYHLQTKKEVSSVKTSLLIR